MKVGTDGVLLGSWADTANCKNVLDIGTGTGLIAIMLGQRCNAQIHGVEIDSDAFLQAEENVENCPWKNRIKLFKSDIIDFSKTPTHSYDLIVSNPPFFSQSLKSENISRNIARHNDSLSIETLAICCKSLASENAKISLILPVTEANTMELTMRNLNYFTARKTLVRPTPDKEVHRILLEFSQSFSYCNIDEITIETSRHQYSHEFKILTRDFYLF